jgi:hypothetical protein
MCNRFSQSDGAMQQFDPYDKSSTDVRVRVIRLGLELGLELGVRVGVRLGVRVRVTGETVIRMLSSVWSVSKFNLKRCFNNRNAHDWV